MIYECVRCKKPMMPGASPDVLAMGHICTCGMPRKDATRHGDMPYKAKEVPMQSESEKPVGSELEELYLSLLAEHAPDLPKPLQQQYIVPDRGFKADFYWPTERLIIEIDGLVHRVKSRFASDAEKHNLYVLSGFTYLRFTGQMLRHDITRVIEWTRQGLERGKG